MNVVGSILGFAALCCAIALAWIDGNTRGYIKGTEESFNTFMSALEDAFKEIEKEHENETGD